MPSVTSASDFSPLPFTDFVSVLRYHAITKAEQTAYIFLADGETESARLTFAQLDQRARAIAVQLQALNLQGQTVLLLYPPSLDYIAAFLGCLYAGVIAVPAYPPSRHHVQRLTAIIEDAKSAIILSHTELAEKLQSTADHTWTQQLPWLLTNETNMALAQQWQSPAICADSLAFLQYTSGSTGDPKGVMISHGNLLSNQLTIQKNFQHQNTTKVVGWLPFYHDMGLIGNILQPLYLGGCAILMPPLAFLEKPVRWLRAISHYRADTSGGPNFAYDLCVNKITAEQKAGLDLSSWSLAFNGAETVRGQTLARFSRAFAECGFRSQSFHPCYGLAEATLFVAGVVKNQPTLLIDDAVSCGQAGIGSQICIVNPQTQTLCAEGQEGEIWCAGSSIAKGYWRKPELSVQIFQAQIIDNKQYFLRTGDLGKREQGQLIITGRLKELIIIRGRNYYPQDIEFTLTAQIPELIAGACVAFSSFKDAEEQLVIVAEITRHAIRQQQFTAILQAIRQHLTQQCELSASEIILVAPGVIPKTSSGKLRRLACKDLYQQKQLPSLVQKQPFTQAVAAMNQADSTLLLLRDTLQNLPIQHATPLLSRFLLHKVAQLIKVDVATLATDLSLVAMGLDSLKIVELKHNLDSVTGKDVPLSLLLSDDSVAVIAESILTNSHAEIISPVAQVNDAGLSHTQQAMWTVQQLHPSSVVYNLHLALHIQGDIKVDCLQQVIAHLLLVHPILRSVYQVNHDLVQQTLLSAESSISCFEQIAADQWSLAMLQHDMRQRVQQPFNLATELPLRITLYQCSQSRYTLLFCVHHIAVDLWSILHLLEELKNHYLAVLNQSSIPAVDANTTQYQHFIAWQRHYLNGHAARQAWDYWRTQLAGELPLLNLAIDYPRPQTASYLGDSVSLTLDISCSQQLKKLASSQGVTLFTLLLAVYKVWLHHHTRQTDIIVGVPTSGRTQQTFANVIGNFVNPLPLRSQLNIAIPFSSYVKQLHQLLQTAVTHQDFPFSLMVENLQPERQGDQWPIYQTLFVLQQAQVTAAQDLAQLALGEDSTAIDWGVWQIKAEKIAQRVVNFDLMLMAAEVSDGLLLSFQYRQDLFKAATVKQFAQQFAVLVEQLIMEPHARLGELSLRSKNDDQQLFQYWNATAIAYPQQGYLPALFAAQVEKTPQATAVIFAGVSISYAELNAQVNRLAHFLCACGVKTDAIVGVCAYRSLEMVVALLAIIKVGGAYLPLDPDNPSERLLTMLEDAQVAWVLHQPDFQGLFVDYAGQKIVLDTAFSVCATQSTANPSVIIHPQSLAYLLYTSGSTGKPKGVGIPHQGIKNRLLWMQAQYQLTAEDTVMQKTTYTFDVSVWEFFWPLLVGAKLLLAEPQAHKDPQRLLSLMLEHNVTTLHFVPSMLRVFLDTTENIPCPALQRVICSGEAVDKDLQTRFQQRFMVQLYNLYGPTEASIDVTEWRCVPQADYQTVPIGRPIANTQIYILNACLNPVAPGCIGELYIGGIQLARGYQNRRGLTASTFIPDPFSQNGDRLYRSGDLAKWNADGVIEYVGRIDHQVKVRGFRIELGEIETRLRQHALIKEVVVIARTEQLHDTQLVAYVVPVQAITGETQIFEAWRQHIRETLPEYMIPAAFVCLDSFPLTLSGKLNRKALPAPDLMAQFSQHYVAPRNATESALAHIWAQILHVEKIGVFDNFFALGGDSIKVIQVVSKATHQAQLAITPQLVFQYPTVAQLAAVVQPLATEANGFSADITPQRLINAPLTTADFPLASLSQAELDALPFKAENIEDIYPLGRMQEGLLFHSLTLPGTGIYVMQDCYEITGAVDVAAFKTAWQKVVDHHPMLRTSFIWDIESPVHQIVHRNVTLPFEFYDWCEFDESQQNFHKALLLQTEQQEGFDFTQPPLMRIRLIQLEKQRYLCVRSFHHILMDEWCTSPLLLEFKANYKAISENQPLPATPARPFRDYIAWLQRQNVDNAAEFWQDYLSGFNEPTPLIINKARTSEPAETGVADVIVQLSVANTQLLEQLTRQHQLTTNTFVQAALALLLRHYSGRDDIVFGVTVAGRPTALPDIEHVIGLFINSLPLRIRVQPQQQVLNWLQALLAQNLQIRQYEYVSLTQIQSWSEVPRVEGELFQHLLTFENAPIDPALRHNNDEVQMAFVDNRVHTNYPLTFVAIPGEQLCLRLTYQRDRFELATVTRMLTHFKQILDSLLHSLDKAIYEVAVIDDVERHILLEQWNQTAHSYPQPNDFIAQFEAQVAKKPHAIAVSCAGINLSYVHLNAQVNCLAHKLIAQGIKPDEVVALLSDRGNEFLIMMLAIFKAGAAYLPLDPQHPEGRLQQVLAESQVRYVLSSSVYQHTISEICANLPSQVEVLTTESDVDQWLNPHSRHNERNLAFVIFTSGSTGKPKGAMVEHRGMYNNLITKVPTLGLTATDVIAQTAGQCFDISVWQHLTALVCGARVEVFSDIQVRDPQLLLPKLVETEVTILEAVPSMIQALLELAHDGFVMPKLRWLIACGEAFPPELCRRWMQRFPAVKVLNAYGPAECSDDVSYYAVPMLPEPTALVIPVGKAVDNTQLYILNRDMQPVAIGIPGEICVGGIQVGRGYLNRPALTAAGFVPNPFNASGETLYRTGDLGRYRDDGSIEFLGRIDHQLKIRGFRIEPGEIEAQLLNHPHVEQAAVLVKEDKKGDKQLVAYLTANKIAAINHAELPRKLRSYLSETLPPYMVPAHFMLLPTMPLSANGKIDRKALPEADMREQLIETFVAPRNSTEEILVAIWQEVLEINQVGVKDNFFDLGGHSLLAVQVLSRVRRIFDIEISLRQLFESSTIEELAFFVEEMLIEKMTALSDEEVEMMLAAQENSEIE